MKKEILLIIFLWAMAITLYIVKPPEDFRIPGHKEEITEKEVAPVVEVGEVIQAEEPEEPEVTIDEYDLEWLAHAMYCENGNSDDETLLLTGIVIMKRVKSTECPDTIEGVITDTRYGIQYACYWNDAWQKYQADERSYEMARAILEGELEKDYPDELIFQAEFPQGSQIYRHIGNQYFCLK